MGDDQNIDDPTMLRLEHMAREKMGKQPAIFLASGTMTNLIAMKAHTQPCDSVLVG